MFPPNQGLSATGNVRGRWIVSVAVGALLLASCSAGVGQKQVAKADLEAQVAKELAAEVGTETPPNISCPDDLAAKVGTKMQCVLSVDGETARYPVSVVVESLENGEVQFDAKVGSTALP